MNQKQTNKLLVLGKIKWNIINKKQGGKVIIMMIDHKESYEELIEAGKKLAEGCAGVMEGFGKLHSEAIKDDALPLKIKELIALGIAISIRCTGCIQAHVKKALDAGAIPEEIYETIGVAILMSGGPGTVYGSMAMEAMEQFSDG